MRGAISNLTIAFLLTGCTSNLSNFHPTTEADPAETGAEGFIYMDELSKAYTRLPAQPGPVSPEEATDRSNSPGKYPKNISHSAKDKAKPSRYAYADTNDDSDYVSCHDFRESYQEHEKYTILRYKTRPKGGKQSARKDFRCVFFKDGATPPEIRNYAMAGFALSDLYCRTFFRRVGLHASTRGYGQDLLNDVGTTMSAILGLASAGSAATGAIGAGFGIAEGAFSDYDKEFLVSADLPSVEKQVIATQQKYVKDFIAGPAPSSYLEAAMDIQQHANFCSFLGMRALVNSAVEADTETKVKGATKPAAPAKLSSGDFGKVVRTWLAARKKYAASKHTAQDKKSYQTANAAFAAAVKAQEAPK